MRDHVSDEELLRAARLVFRREGIRATSRQIAREASVAKGTLTARFGSMDELLCAAMAAQPPPWTRQLDAAIGLGDVRDNLAGLFVEMVRWSARVAPLAVLGLSVPSMQDGVDAETMRGERELAGYLEEEMALGRLRYGDPLQWARLLAAAAWDRALVGGVESPSLCLDAMWGGLEPREDELEIPSSNGPCPVWPPRPADPMPLVEPLPPAERASVVRETAAPASLRREAAAPASAVRATTRPAADGCVAETTAGAADLERTQRSARLLRADGRPMLTMLRRVARCFRRRGGRRPRRRVRRPWG